MSDDERANRSNDSEIPSNLIFSLLLIFPSFFHCVYPPLFYLSLLQPHKTFLQEPETPLCISSSSLLQVGWSFINKFLPLFCCPAVFSSLSLVSRTEEKYPRCFCGPHQRANVVPLARLPFLPPEKKTWIDNLQHKKRTKERERERKI